MNTNTLRYFEDYKNKNQIRKLHLGAGNISLDRWFNIDLYPDETRGIYFMDMTQPFVFEDKVFDFIYSEHNFEHFSLEDIYKILNECYRVLKPKGIIRIATPDLKKIINFYNKKSDLHNEYNKWEVDCFIPFAREKGLYNKAIVLNNFFRCWGHQFIYDFETMKTMLRLCGFKRIKKCKIYNSEYEDLVNIESHGKNIGEAFNEIETMVIEAKR